MAFSHKVCNIPKSTEFSKWIFLRFVSKTLAKFQTAVRKNPRVPRHHQTHQKKSIVVHTFLVFFAILCVPV